MDEAYDHFKIFGRTPRYVYQTSEQAKRTKEGLDGKIKQLDMSALSVILNDLEMIRYYQDRLSHQRALISSCLILSSSAEFCAPNFPVIDALFEEGAFNYTVAKRHGIKPQPCKELLTKLGVSKDKPLKLYWARSIPNQPKNNQHSQQKGGAEDNDFIEAQLCHFALELPTIHGQVSQLQELCVKKGLATSGTKSELISRLEGKE
ncbi:hypothetical protein QOT17_025376 [Balamuthia mandrillaris]